MELLFTILPSDLVYMNTPFCLSVIFHCVCIVVMAWNIGLLRFITNRFTTGLGCSGFDGLSCVSLNTFHYLAERMTIGTHPWFFSIYFSLIRLRRSSVNSKKCFVAGFIKLLLLMAAERTILVLLPSRGYSILEGSTNTCRERILAAAARIILKFVFSCSLLGKW